MRRVRIQRASGRRGFTLLEVLMVIVIIGVLAAFVVPSFFGAGEKAKIDLTRALVQSGINGVLDLYKMRMGHYPTDDEGGLQALITPPDDEELAKKWYEPFIKEGTKLEDSWGSELIYSSPGEYNENTYDLSSPGPNGIEGDDDDITNWDQI